MITWITKGPISKTITVINGFLKGLQFFQGISLIDRYKQNQSLELLQRPIRLLSEALKSDSRLGSSFYAGLEKALCKTKQHKLAEEIFKVLDFF